MKNTARIIGWICFAIASAVYLIATCYFAIGFASAIADYLSGETVGIGVVFLVFLIIGSIVYAAVAAISMIGAIVANVRRRERKLFFAPMIPLILSVLTWMIFFLLGICF